MSMWKPTAALTIGLFGACVATLTAAQGAPHRMYEMTTATGMPHLDENLRYATLTQKQCLDTRDLAGVFWMLKDVSLQDCKLVKVSESAETAAYQLHCSGGHGTTGEATWQLGPAAIAGTLNVRLGGKNMTFYQRITARPIGPCD